MDRLNAHQSHGGFNKMLKANTARSYKHKKKRVKNLSSEISEATSAAFIARGPFRIEGMRILDRRGCLIGTAVTEWAAIQILVAIHFDNQWEGYPIGNPDGEELMRTAYRLRSAGTLAAGIISGEYEVAGCIERLGTMGGLCVLIDRLPKFQPVAVMSVSPDAEFLGLGEAKRFLAFRTIEVVLEAAEHGFFPATKVWDAASGRELWKVRAAELDLFHRSYTTVRDLRRRFPDVSASSIQAALHREKVAARMGRSSNGQAIYGQTEAEAALKDRGFGSPAAEAPPPRCT